jgi:hypothetical protein
VVAQKDWLLSWSLEEQQQLEKHCCCSQEAWCGWLNLISRRRSLTQAIFFFFMFENCCCSNLLNAYERENLSNKPTLLKGGLKHGLRD